MHWHRLTSFLQPRTAEVADEVELKLCRSAEDVDQYRHLGARRIGDTVEIRKPRPFIPSSESL